MSFPYPLTSKADRNAARALVGGTCLKFEEDFDDLLGIFDSGKLIACGARAGRVLKMLVVEKAYRGAGLLGVLVSELMRRGRESSVEGFFIFTRPETKASFEGLGFKPLGSTERAVLLEHGNGVHHYLRARAHLIRSGRNAALVLTGDPFTRGHRFLAESACERADWVYVLVPSEGRFVWPLEMRLEQIRKGLAHLSNVSITETGPYSLSNATFPAYFLKPGETLDEVSLEVDAEVFAHQLAPPFSIECRVVGSEPTNPTLRRYNQILRRRLGSCDIRLLEIERVKLGDLWINRHVVQNALVNGDLNLVEKLVPESTFTYLLLPESKRVIESLAHKAGDPR